MTPPFGAGTKSRLALSARARLHVAYAAEREHRCPVQSLDSPWGCPLGVGHPTCTIPGASPGWPQKEREERNYHFVPVPSMPVRSVRKDAFPFLKTASREACRLAGLASYDLVTRLPGLVDCDVASCHPDKKTMGVSAV